VDTGELQLLDGRYRLLHRLGAGGMSVVWRAHDEVLDREVAVKVLTPTLATEPELLRRIRLEARAAARLCHPNIVEVHDYGESSNGDGLPHPYVVMELIAGRSLSDLLTAGALPWRLAVLICGQVAGALAAAHARGVVHRDVTPGNVMVTANGVKLVDFGISATAGEADAGSGGQVLGTPAYLAPERIDGGPVRRETDVYALGLLLYRTLAGRSPWRTSTTTEMLLAHRYADPAPLPEVSELPPEVAELCHRCLAKQPQDRPSAAEAARILAEAAGLAPAMLLPATDPSGHFATTTLASTAASVPTFATGTTPVPASALTRTGRSGPWRERARRHPVLVATAGAVALLTSGGLALLPDGTDAPQAPATGAVPLAVTGMGARTTDCRVRYEIRRHTVSRFSSAVTITNTGSTSVSRWQLDFTLPSQQRVVRGWTGVWRQEGASVRATGGRLAPGASATTGFDGTYDTVNALPTEFHVNETACQAELVAATTGPAIRQDGDRAKGKKNRNHEGENEN
jgi:serine/threonine-protein kinase